MNAIEKTLLSDEDSNTNLGGDVFEQKSTIDSKVHKILKNKSKYFHNRVTLVATISIPISPIIAIYSLSLIPGTDDIASKHIYLACSVCSIIGLSIAFFLRMITEYGEATGKNYLRTIKNINRRGYLKEEEFIGMMGKWDKNRLTGYCEAQGIYLGMKEFGMEKEFKEMKKRLTKNILPNF